MPLISPLEMAALTTAAASSCHHDVYVHMCTYMYTRRAYLPAVAELRAEARRHHDVYVHMCSYMYTRRAYLRLGFLLGLERRSPLGALRHVLRRIAERMGARRCREDCREDGGAPVRGCKGV